MANGGGWHWLWNLCWATTLLARPYRTWTLRSRRFISEYAHESLRTLRVNPRYYPDRVWTAASRGYALIGSSDATNSRGCKPYAVFIVSSVYLAPRLIRLQGHPLDANTSLLGANPFDEVQLR